MSLSETSGGAAMGVILTSVGAVGVGAAMDVAAVSGPWYESDGGGFDDGVGGPEGSPEGGQEPVFRRFSYNTFSSMVLVFDIVLFLYQFAT